MLGFRPVFQDIVGHGKCWKGGEESVGKNGRSMVVALSLDVTEKTGIV